MYTSKIDDEDYYESLVMRDTDFQNRTALKIITTFGFEPLLSEDDSKSENIIKTIFIGRVSKLCDGNTLGYSNFLHIISEQPHYQEDTPFETILSSNFVPKMQVDYSF